MEWESPERESVILLEKELGELVVDVEAKSAGFDGAILCQVEIRTACGPLRRYGHPRNQSSISRLFKFDPKTVDVFGLNGEAESPSPGNTALWISDTVITNYEGHLSHAQLDRLKCEKLDGGRDDRLIRAYMADAKRVLEAAVNCCLVVHITNISIRYNQRVSGRISRERLLECWDRWIVVSVMDS